MKSEGRQRDVASSEELVAEAWPTYAAARRRWLGTLEEYRTAVLAVRWVGMASAIRSEVGFSDALAQPSCL